MNTATELLARAKRIAWLRERKAALYKVSFFRERDEVVAEILEIEKELGQLVSAARGLTPVKEVVDGKDLLGARSEAEGVRESDVGAE